MKYLIFIFFVFAMGVSSLANVAGESVVSDSSDMVTSGPGANMKPGGVMADASYNNGLNISSQNRFFAKLSYSLAVILAVLTLFVFFKVNQIRKQNFAKARKIFIIGVVMAIAAMILFIMPNYLFYSPSFPGNFDMRAT